MGVQKDAALWFASIAGHWYFNTKNKWNWVDRPNALQLSEACASRKRLSLIYQACFAAAQKYGSLHTFKGNTSLFTP